MKLPDFLRVSIEMTRLSGAPRWMIPVAIVLTVIAFLSEGFGIYMLIPLVNVMAGGELEAAGVGLSSSFIGSALSEVSRYFEGPNQAPAILATIILLIFFRAVFLLASQGLFLKMKYLFGENIRLKVFRQLMFANQNYLDAQPQGQILNMLTQEAWRLSEGLQSLAKLITHVCAVIVFFGLMLAISARLMVIVGIGSLVIIGIVYAVTSSARRLGDAAGQDNRRLIARVNEGIGGLRTIRLFGRERHEFDRFAAAAAQLSRSFFAMEMLNELTHPLILFLFAVFVAVLLTFSGQDQFVELVVFLVLLQRMQPHVNNMLNMRAKLLNLAQPLTNVATLLRDPGASALPSGPLPAPKPQGVIAFERVRYRYPTATEDALKGVSIELPVGRTTALVGASGAGKSTVLQLICRQIDPDQGRVAIDDVDLRECETASWRARLAVVPQDVYLFDASLRENIAYGKLDATDAEIEEAARAAGAMEFISALPDGLDTRLGDRGSRLSGGQRQRIALARALIRNPDVLVLDEATNALDNLSERLVRDAIQRNSRGRTVIVVAHRLANVMNADKIVVMDKGRVVEEGAPQSLLEARGAFSALVSAETLDVA
jgi:subfamily B ATP-binding cassette protein MsbA